MALLYVKPFGGKDYSIDTSGKKYMTRYNAKSDSPTESLATFRSDSRIPQFGEVSSSDSTILCTRVNPIQNKDNPYLWEVQVEWTTGQYGGRNHDPREDDKSPPDRRPKWSAKFVRKQMNRYFDLDNKPFVDAAGTPFSPPPQIPVILDQITIQLYKATWDRTTDRTFMNATNTDTWQNAETGEALVDDISAEEIYEMGGYWFHYTYIILIAPKISVGNGNYFGGFDYEYILNAGPKELNDAGKAVAIEYDGYHASGPTPLTTAGKAMRVEKYANPAAYLAAINYIKFRCVNKVAYSGLHLTPPWQT